jgi:hypothetical protein
MSRNMKIILLLVLAAAVWTALNLYLFFSNVSHG